MSAIDTNQQIVLTPFTVGQVLALLDSSECAEWHRLTAVNGGPTNVRVESLSGKGYLSAVNRVNFGFSNGQNAVEFRVVLKVPNCMHKHGIVSSGANRCRYPANPSIGQPRKGQLFGPSDCRLSHTRSCLLQSSGAKISAQHSRPEHTDSSRLGLAGLWSRG